MDIAYNKTDGVVLPVTNTRISASEYNQIAGSLMHIINTAGLTPDAGDNAQLLNALGPRIVKTYVNGTSWYRVYSDGWCEQGGRTGVVGDARGTNVTFLKEFGDTNYMVCITLQTTIDDYKPGENNIAKLLTTGFSVWCQDVGSSVYFHWKAEGYLPSES